MEIYQSTSSIELLHYILTENGNQWGYQSRLAQAAGCQRSYFSQVLKGKAILTQDQALAIGVFLGFDADQTQFFLLLISEERAATPALMSFCRNEINKKREAKENLAKRFQVPTIEMNKHQYVYYSTWLMSALHILVGIEKFQTASALSERLQVPKLLVQNSLQQLAQISLIEEYKKGSWRPIKSQIHLARDSLFTTTNHMNWRQRAMIDSQMGSSESTHYTAVMSIAPNDIKKIKKVLLETIDRSREIATASTREDAVCLAVDFFSV